jgi:hypothetical protein
MNTTSDRLPSIHFVKALVFFKELQIFRPMILKFLIIFNYFSNSSVSVPLGVTSIDLPQNFIFGLTLP